MAKILPFSFLLISRLHFIKHITFRSNSCHHIVKFLFKQSLKCIDSLCHFTHTAPPENVKIYPFALAISWNEFMTDNYLWWSTVSKIVYLSQMFCFGFHLLKENWSHNVEMDDKSFAEDQGIAEACTVAYVRWERGWKYTNTKDCLKDNLKLLKV